MEPGRLVGFLYPGAQRLRGGDRRHARTPDRRSRPQGIRRDADEGSGGSYRRHVRYQRVAGRHAVALFHLRVSPQLSGRGVDGTGLPVRPCAGADRRRRSAASDHPRRLRQLPGVVAGRRAYRLPCPRATFGRRDSPCIAPHLYTMAPGGSDVRHLARTVVVQSYPPQWSPDGQWLAVVAREPRGPPRHLCRTRGWDGRPAAGTGGKRPGLVAGRPAAGLRPSGAIDRRVDDHRGRRVGSTASGADRRLAVSAAGI